MSARWSDHLISFYRSLQPPPLPEGIQWLYPQQDPKVMQVVEAFLRKFYSDKEPRTLMFGINPGRFGAGITGVNFTAARQLTQNCGIEHPFREGSELSAEFIYDMIGAYGGVQPFYARYFISSVCPLGFVRNGKNLNYYDDRDLLEAVSPFIFESMEQLLRQPSNRSVAFAIGGEKNFRHFSDWNRKHGWFEKIVPLPHPRFIMQYRRRQKDQFIGQYLQSIRS